MPKFKSKNNGYLGRRFLDSSDECIDFTMMCIFLLCFSLLVSVWDSKTASIFSNRRYLPILFDGKVNLVGAQI